MVTAIAAGQALKGGRVIKSNGTGEEHWRTDYIGTRSTGAGSGNPQAFLIEMRAGEAILSHYHEVDQFQVFVAGSGRSAATKSRRSPCTPVPKASKYCNCSIRSRRRCPDRGAIARRPGTLWRQPRRCPAGTLSTPV